MIRFVAAILALALLPSAVAAEDFEPVKSKEDFLSLVGDRELRLGLYSISLTVKPNGRIDGTALGWAVTGEWAWEDGYFCRELDWSGTPIPYNCQLVEARADKELRFTVDKGAGRAASFRLR